MCWACLRPYNKPKCRSCNKPVTGWKAEWAPLESSFGSTKPFVPSWNVRECPLFVRDERFPLPRARKRKPVMPDKLFAFGERSTLRDAAEKLELTGRMKELEPFVSPEDICETKFKKKGTSIIFLLNTNTHQVVICNRQDVVCDEICISKDKFTRMKKNGIHSYLSYIWWIM